MLVSAKAYLISRAAVVPDDGAQRPGAGRGQLEAQPAQRRRRGGGRGPGRHPAQARRRHARPAARRRPGRHRVRHRRRLRHPAAQGRWRPPSRRARPRSSSSKQRRHPAGRVGHGAHPGRGRAPLCWCWPSPSRPATSRCGSSAPPAPWPRPGCSSARRSPLGCASASPSRRSSSASLAVTCVGGLHRRPRRRRGRRGAVVVDPGHHLGHGQAGVRRARPADAPDANRGRSFARFETRFQLAWVIGAFIPRGPVRHRRADHRRRRLPAHRRADGDRPGARTTRPAPGRRRHLRLGVAQPEADPPGLRRRRSDGRRGRGRARHRPHGGARRARPAGADPAAAAAAAPPAPPPRPPPPPPAPPGAAAGVRRAPARGGSTSPPRRPRTELPPPCRPPPARSPTSATVEAPPAVPVDRDRRSTDDARPPRRRPTGCRRPRRPLVDPTSATRSDAEPRRRPAWPSPADAAARRRPLAASGGDATPASAARPPSRRCASSPPLAADRRRLGPAARQAQVVGQVDAGEPEAGGVDLGRRRQVVGRTPTGGPGRRRRPARPRRRRRRCPGRTGPG